MTDFEKIEEIRKFLRNSSFALTAALIVGTLSFLGKLDYEDVDLIRTNSAFLNIYYFLLVLIIISESVMLLPDRYHKHRVIPYVFSIFVLVGLFSYHSGMYSVYPSENSLKLRSFDYAKEVEAEMKNYAKAYDNSIECLMMRRFAEIDLSIAQNVAVTMDIDWSKETDLLENSCSGYLETLSKANSDLDAARESADKKMDLLIKNAEQQPSEK